MMPSTVTTAILLRASLSSSTHSSSFGPMSRAMRGWKPLLNRRHPRDKLREVAEQADAQQHEQDDGENHPAPAPARLGRRRRRDDRGGVKAAGGGGDGGDSGTASCEKGVVSIASAT